MFNLFLYLLSQFLSAEDRSGILPQPTGCGFATVFSQFGTIGKNLLRTGEIYCSVIVSKLLKWRSFCWKSFVSLRNDQSKSHYKRVKVYCSVIMMNILKWRRFCWKSLVSSRNDQPKFSLKYQIPALYEQYFCLGEYGEYFPWGIKVGVEYPGIKKKVKIEKNKSVQKTDKN